MIREIDTKEIAEAIKDMCIAVNYKLSPDMEEKLSTAVAKEESELGKKILLQLKENLEIAEQEQIPICQDTGMAVVFLEIGQEVHFVGGSLEEAVHSRHGEVRGRACNRADSHNARPVGGKAR